MTTRFASVVAVLFLVAIGSASAQSHLGQSPLSHVTLQMFGSGFDLGACEDSGDPHDFKRLLPNGTSVGPFRVPAGQVLVVTDVDWLYNELDLPEAPEDLSGKSVGLRLYVENLGDPNQRERAMESTIVLDQEGIGGTSVAATTGFVISSEARLCVDTSPFPMANRLSHLIVRGYLTRAR